MQRLNVYSLMPIRRLKARSDLGVQAIFMVDLILLRIDQLSQI